MPLLCQVFFPSMLLEVVMGDGMPCISSWLAAFFGVKEQSGLGPAQGLQEIRS